MTRIAFEAAIADRTERLDAARQKGEEMIRNLQALVTEQEVLEGEIHCLAQGFEWGLATHDPEEAPDPEEPAGAEPKRLDAEAEAERQRQEDAARERREREATIAARAAEGAKRQAEEKARQEAAAAAERALRAQQAAEVEVLSERQSREKCQEALRRKDAAMSVLFSRLQQAGIDVSDLIS